MSDISVLLATHNSEKYLSAQLDSLITQTLPVHIFVSDDFSTDSTLEILKKYPVTLIKSDTPLKSAQENFMFLLQNVPHADYYMFCDHDDVWLKDKVERTLNKMLELDNNKPALVHGELAVADEKLNIISESMFVRQKLDKIQSLERTLIQNNVTGCTVMINNALRDIAIKKHDTKDMIMHDWFLALLASACGSVGFVEPYLMLYRQHGNNEVGAKDASSIKYIVQKAFSSKNKESLERTFYQAKMIAELYKNELGEKYTVFNEYGSCIDKSKLERIKICKKYGIRKNTLLRYVGQIIFM